MLISIFYADAGFCFRRRRFLRGALPRMLLSCAAAPRAHAAIMMSRERCRYALTQRMRAFTSRADLCRDAAAR